MRLSNVPILTQEICSSRSWRGTAAVRTASPQSVSCAQRRGYTPVRAMMGTSPLHALLPISVLTDSYKATHFMQYPDTKKMVAYGEFRSGYDKDKNDTRLVFYGIRYIVENHILRQWTEADVEEAERFYSTHMAPGFTAFPFPKDLFLKFVRENNGYFPVRLEALPEGTAIHARVPVYQITSEGAYAPLCTFLESLLTQVWYPTCVATLSRRARDVIEASFDTTSDAGAASPLVTSRLHDFGFRGCTGVEQAVLGGAAHLLNFEGSDNMAAAYYAQFHLNGGRPVASSIPASEHSVMTAWPSETDAMRNMVRRFGDGTFSVVMDSYDYAKALSEVLPAVASEQVDKGGYLVLRPDSGDPVEAVLMALHAAEKVFGSKPNGKGARVIPGCGVIQGDGINIKTLAAISHAVKEAGFCAENVAYGMGGGLLQKVNRDTMSFATKLCHIVYADGRAADVMKQPQTDAGKFSLPGALAVKRVAGVPTVFPADSGEVSADENMLKVVYDCGPVEGHQWDNFETVRRRVGEQWPALPRKADNLSASLKSKVAQQMLEHGKKMANGAGH